MAVEHWWIDIHCKKPKLSWWNLSQCYFVHHN